tara:strand:- start:238 stop:438 length:201 start_codon:yes stop_codon:yes gene_type:complete
MNENTLNRGFKFYLNNEKCFDKNTGAILLKKFSIMKKNSISHITKSCFFNKLWRHHFIRRVIASLA